MSCNKIWINDFDIQSPVIPIGCDITDTLFNPKENWVSKRQFDFAALIGPYRKDVRRMNRTSTLGYLSATSIMEKSGLAKESFDPYGFGTVFSTTNASYESVLAVLNSLYQKSIEDVSPINFTYSVGNSLISGITMKYGLKGPSTMLPSTEPLLVASMILEQEDAERILVGNYNICLDDNLNFYRQFDYLQGDDQHFTGILEDAKGMVIREQAVSLVLESDAVHTGKEGCVLAGLSIKRKKKINSTLAQGQMKNMTSAYNINSFVELSHFSPEDFEETIKLALSESGVAASQVDAVIMCSCGNPGLDNAEYKAVSSLIPDAKMVSVHGIFGSNFGSSFMLNCAVAVASLQKQMLPPSEGVIDSKGRFTTKTESLNLKTVLVNGYNDLGNMITGVIKWN